MEQPVKSAFRGTGQLVIGTCHFMFLKSVISSNFALLFSAPNVAVSVGLITAAAAAYARRLYIGGRPQTITQVMEVLGSPSDVVLVCIDIPTMAASSS